jgi:hyperosmotically inducible periplasmic protein
MTTPQLLSGALGLTLSLSVACNRTDANREAREAATEVRAAAAQAGDRLSDGWLTTKVQAQYFADQDIKARYINVSSRDGVVTLSGYVESPAARAEAVQIARNTDGVRSVDDQLLIGVSPKDEAFATARDTDSGAVATGGSAGADAAAAERRDTLDDDRITSMVQARFFLDPVVKARAIDVVTDNGVVTLRGNVANESERAQALLLARQTNGVGRVEDMLTVK